MPLRRNVFTVLGALTLLCVPVALSLGRHATFSESENRVLAPFPERPTTLHEVAGFPGRVDAFLRDHLGLRDWMTWAYATLRVRLLHSGNASVVLGNGDWLFYRGEDNLEKSAGLYRRDDEIARTVAILAAMQRDLAAQGAKLLVAEPPNNATIELAALPPWARNHGVPTQYDAMMEALRARAIPVLDLRPALRAAAAQGAAYQRHDTHWTPRGAVSALNAILEWSGAGWQADPATLLGPPTLKVGGDESKMLGLNAQYHEEVEPLLLPHRPIAEPKDQFPYREAGGRPDGKRILMLGDSFTYSFFAPVLRPQVSELMWVAHRGCSFDWSMVADFHPDEVWWVPTERLINCAPNLVPRHLDLGG